MQIVVEGRTNRSTPRVVDLRRRRGAGWTRCDQRRSNIALVVGHQLASIDVALGERSGGNSVVAQTSGKERSVTFPTSRGPHHDINGCSNDHAEVSVAVSNRSRCRPVTRLGCQIGLEYQASRARIGVVQRSGQERRHGGTGHVCTRVVSRRQETVVDTKVPQLDDGIVTCNGHRTGIDIGVVIGATVAVNVQGQGAVGLATWASRSDMEQSLNKQGHLFTGDVVSRSEGGRRLTDGDTQLLDLVDGRLDLSRVAADIGEALIGTCTQRDLCGASHPGQVEGHLPTRNTGCGLIGGRRDTSGDAVHGDAVHVG